MELLVKNCACLIIAAGEGSGSPVGVAGVALIPLPITLSFIQFVAFCP